MYTTVVGEDIPIYSLVDQAATIPEAADKIHLRSGGRVDSVKANAYIIMERPNATTI